MPEDRDRHGRRDGGGGTEGGAAGPGGGARRDGRPGGNRGSRDRGRRPSTQRTTARPSERARAADPARLAAYDVLRAVGDADSYANLVLPGLLAERHLSGRDAGFATELTYGTLRLQGRYDAVIAHASSRGTDRLDPEVLDVLRLGTHQVLGMRVPAHAAVSESVALARQTCGTGPAQLVNAVLRRVTERSLEDWLTLVGDAAEDETARLAVVHSHPEWVVRAMRQALAATVGGADDLEALLEADNTAPAVTLVVRPGLADPEEVPGATAGRWAPTALRSDGGDPGALAAVREGRVGVQDEGSQLVALAAAAAPLDGSDSTWLDLCAGPGGKAALSAALLAERDPSGVLVANEVAPHRARLVEQALAAVRPWLAGLEVRTADGRDLGETEEGRYDRVLVDAPCTGLGALRRRPESRWRRTPGDLTGLGPLQRDLLAAALRATRPGGVVAYVTCSPHLAETRFVVEDVLKRFPSAQLLDAPAVLLQVSLEPIPGLSGPYAQLWPHRHGTDAMFLALIRR